MDRFYLENKKLYQKLVDGYDAGAPAPHFSRHTTTTTPAQQEAAPEHPNMVISARIRPMLADDVAVGFPCAVYPRSGQTQSDQFVDIHDLHHHPRQRPVLRVQYSAPHTFSSCD